MSRFSIVGYDTDDGQYRLWCRVKTQKRAVRVGMLTLPSKPATKNNTAFWRAYRDTVNPRIAKYDWRIAICRRCEAIGWENPSMEFAPDLCPDCFEDDLAGAFGFRVSA